MHCVCSVVVIQFRNFQQQRGDKLSTVKPQGGSVREKPGNNVPPSRVVERQPFGAERQQPPAPDETPGLGWAFAGGTAPGSIAPPGSLPPHQSQQMVGPEERETLAAAGTLSEDPKCSVGHSAGRRGCPPSSCETLSGTRGN